MELLKLMLNWCSQQLYVLTVEVVNDSNVEGHLDGDIEQLHRSKETRSHSQWSEGVEEGL